MDLSKVNRIRGTVMVCPAGTPSGRCTGSPNGLPKQLSVLTWAVRHASPAGSIREGVALMRFVVSVVLIAIGVAAVVAGGADDSPGLQGLGVAAVVGGLVLGVRALRGRRRVSRARS
jgi:hypothetical protein